MQGGSASGKVFYPLYLALEALIQLSEELLEQFYPMRAEYSRRVARRLSQ